MAEPGKLCTKQVLQVVQCNFSSYRCVGAHRSTDCASYRDTHVPSELFSGQCDTAHKNPTKLTYTKHNYTKTLVHTHTHTHTHTRSHANHTRCLLNHSLIHVHTCSLIPNKARNTNLTAVIIVLMEYSHELTSVLQIWYSSITQ